MFRSRLLVAALVAPTLIACDSSSGGSATPGNDAGSDAAGDAAVATCSASSADGLADCVEQSRLEADVTFVAQPRPPGSAHWQAVQDLCAERFAQYGFEVTRHKYATGVNVIGKRVGTSKPSEQIVVSAHYDHIPGCAGADDNATGVAGLLEAARILGPKSFERTLVVACWDEEEDGLIGSQAYAMEAKSRGDDVVEMFSLEMLGYTKDEPNAQQVPAGFEILFPAEYKQVQDNEFRADFLALVALDTSKSTLDTFAAQGTRVGLPVVRLPLTIAQATNPLLGDLQRSDHAAFWQEGYPGIMVTDTSNFRYQNYHCALGPDDVSQLDFAFMTKVTRAQIGTTAEGLALVP